MNVPVATQLAALMTDRGMSILRSTARHAAGSRAGDVASDELTTQQGRGSGLATDAEALNRILLLIKISPYHPPRI